MLKNVFILDNQPETDENFVLRQEIFSLEDRLSSRDEEILKVADEKCNFEKKFLSAKNEYKLQQMYIQQLEDDHEALKKEKSEGLCNRLVQDLEKKTEEANDLSSHVKELNKKFKESEAENEKLYVYNMALKSELEEKEEEPNLSLKVEELQNKLNKANKALSYKPSSTAINPMFMNKIKKLKADRSLSKIEKKLLKKENKLLKKEIRKRDLYLLKTQNLQDIFQSSAEDDDEDNSKDMNVDTDARSFSSKISDSRSSFAEPESSVNVDDYHFDLDSFSPGKEQSADIGRSERLPALDISVPATTTGVKHKKASSKLANSHNSAKIIYSRPLVGHTIPKERELSHDKPVYEGYPTSRPDKHTRKKTKL